jgi:hypothetical protein
LLTSIVDKLAPLFCFFWWCRSPHGAVSAGDDAWLIQKGKKFVASPEVAMGRRGLAEVLAHGSSNPYEDGRPLDDAWLQPSGKLKVPGGCRHGSSC